MRLFSSKVTRLTIVGPLALVYIALHRGDYSRAALWFCISFFVGWYCLQATSQVRLEL